MKPFEGFITDEKPEKHHFSHFFCKIKQPNSIEKESDQVNFVVSETQ